MTTDDWSDPASSIWHDDHEPDWPEWVRGFRDHQLQATEEVLDGFDRGKRIMVLDAPVGSGKTLIAEMVRRALGESMLFVPHSKSLQDQFIADFPYAQMLKGRANYPVEMADAWPWPEFSADDCTAAGDKTCVMCVDACPYKTARQAARTSRVTVVNSAYAIREAGGKGSVCGNRKFSVVDECDTLEGVLLGAVEFAVSEWQVREWGIGPVPKKGSRLTTIAAWLEDVWMVEAEARYKELVREGQRGLGHRDQVEVQKKKRRLAQRMQTAKQVVDGIRSEDERQTWIRDYDDRGRNVLVLKPVTVDWAGEQMVWRHAEKWLVMSGTVVDADVMMDGLGVERSDWELIEVPMTFPKENRPVKIAPLGDMSRKGADEDLERVLRGLRVVLERHRGQNTVVHTVSYKLARLAREVAEEVVGCGEVWAYDNARDRDQVIEQFKEHGGVLIGPSVDRGVDLPGDLCRVQVVLKVPYPNLGDKRTSERMRMAGGQRWYGTETARTIVQMCGRGVRSADDECVVYVLDKMFLKWYNMDGKNLLPKWWRDGMKMERTRDYE